MKGGQERYRKKGEGGEREEKKKGFKERKKGGDDYIHLYIHHTGYEREHGVLKPDPKMAVHKTESTGQTEKLSWHPINRKQKYLIADGIPTSAAASLPRFNNNNNNNNIQSTLEVQ
ncbi:hypothetical protein E3U43_004980 [Larimichthys crocea]|uniref:Uncharacterized protein n=1 Tax=Larimichthys crocea TaxID=215358 RepID=A0ACD3QET5_LARCR|nr:hypothetical protein E3U43_004980 [Larimichthys crocea]